MRITILLFALASFLFSCGGETEVFLPEVTFAFEGLPGYTTKKMERFQNFIFATTDFGLYRKNLSLSSSEWELVGFQNQNTEALEVFDLNTIMVSVVDVDSPENSTIYKTNDGGTNWSEFQGGWGGITKEPLYDIESIDGNSSMLYGTGAGVVAKSTDQGATWTPVWGNWDALAGGIKTVAINPSESSEVWAGGQNAIEGGVLLRNLNNGAAESWEAFTSLVENPTTVKSIAFDEATSTIYSGWEGALLKSTDNGENWTTVIDAEDNRFFFDIIADPSEANTIYAGGWLKQESTPQDLILFRSKDNGSTWETFETSGNGALFGGIRQMILVEDPFSKKIFFGLIQGGIYSASIAKE